MVIADTVKVNPESRTMLPKMAFTGFASRYREPSLNEGFQDITKVDFQVRPLSILASAHYSAGTFPFLLHDFEHDLSPEETYLDDPSFFPTTSTV